MKNRARDLLAVHQPTNKNIGALKDKKFFSATAKTFLSFVLLFSFIVSWSTVSAQTNQLYFSDPAQTLDRVDPVGTADNTTTSSYSVYQAQPGVLVDAVSTKVANIGPITLAHTTGTGSCRLMLVGISQKNKLVTSVTYGGVALTLVGENIASANSRVSIYQLLNPASGTANVVVSFNGNPDKGAVIGVTTFSNVDQITPLGTFASVQANAINPSVTVTSAAGELVYDVVSKRNQALTVGASQTQRWNLASGWEIYGSSSTEPGAASTIMSWTAGSSDGAIGAVSIKPATSFNTISFTQAPVMCSDLTITTAASITVTSYLSSVTGTMPANPNITVTLNDNSTVLLTLSSPVYNSGTGLITWTGIMGANKIVPATDTISLVITNSQSGTSFKIDYDSQTKPSKINFPVLEYINVNSLNVYTAAYPAGTIVASGVGGTTKYVRAVVSDPFGTADITALNYTITPTGSVFAGNLVATNGCTRTYEYVWPVPVSTTNYTITATAKQGYENTVTHSRNTGYSACTLCPPVAFNDSSSGSGGVPIVVDALFNDYDPNGNLRISSLAVSVQPRNGTAYISNYKLVYLPNGTYSGRDTVTYTICDSTSLCTTGMVFFSIDPVFPDPCSDAIKRHIYYLPYSENEARIALDSSSSVGMFSNNIRTVISLRVPYTGMVVIWDHWEDGYEANILNPTQSTTQVWGDGNLFNGIAPGYPTDIIANNGSIVLDNTIPTNPRVSSNIFYDGRDKIYSSGQIAVTQVCGEPLVMGVQCMKTNVSSTAEYGTSFTIPVGQNFNSQDFYYSSLFIRASENNTVINIDKDNDGTLETTATINEGEVYHVNGGVMTGATVTSSAPIGCDLHFGGHDFYSSRDIPIYPASWYSHTYYSPVPTTGSSTAIKDTAVVMMYNSLNRSIVINWSSGIPSSGSITIPAKTVVRFPLALSLTAAYKFVNPTGESFTAIEIVDSYTPGGGGNSGSSYDWSFNLISESRLSDFTTIAWAPGSTDGTTNDNPIWVTPTANTTIYVKYNGDVTSGGLTSPCGLHYDVSYTLNALNHKRLLDPNDNDQSGLAVFTCDGNKIAAVYGEDPSTAQLANPSWDVGSTLQPFCRGKLIFANDDYATTLVGQPVTISVLLNDFGFLAVVDPTTLGNTGLLRPKHGTVSINSNGTILYTPNAGYIGNDTLEYQVCSTPSPIVCDIAQVFIKISACGASLDQNTISGQVFVDKNKDGVNNDGGTGVSGLKVYLYTDGNCTGTIDANELTDSVTVDASGTYQFTKYAEKNVADDFDAGGTRSCANGTDGNAPWLTDWVDAGDGSVGFCNTTKNAATTDCDIFKDGAFSYGIRLKDNGVSCTRTVNLSGVTKAFFTFSYRRKSTTLAAGEDVSVQVSPDGTTFTTIYTISGNGTADAAYVTVYNQDISAYASATTNIRFVTNSLVDDQDTVYIDNVKIRFLKYSQCYITQLNTSNVPANNYLTTVTQRPTTFSSGATCTSQFDFGLAKTSIGVSGTLYNDANGLTDALVNGTAIGNPSGTTVYAYLIDSLGKVAFKSTVNSGTGVYSFPLADVSTIYTLMLSTLDSAILAGAPASPNLGSVWVAVGDAYGTNNSAGSSIEAGTPNTSIAVRTAATSVTNVNFGIERVPNSVNYLTSITQPVLNQVIILNGGMNPPVLSGSDPEDCSGGCVLTTRSVKIDTVPGNADLYYNSILVTDGQLITNFNPALLQVAVTSSTMGDTSILFNYSYVDLASKKDPTPASYRLIWTVPLPADGLLAQAELNGTTAKIKWMTLSEQLTDYFVLERSLDNIHFTALDTVGAAGNSVSNRYYQQPDDISSLLQQPVIFYRVKLVDLDGRFKYSNVVLVRLSKIVGVTTWPNPFSSSITVNVSGSQNTELNIRLTDIEGRTILSNTRPVSRGASQITVEGLDRLAQGIYLLDIADKASGTKTVFKMLKAR